MLDLLGLRGLPYLQMVVWLWLMEERKICCCAGLSHVGW